MNRRSFCLTLAASLSASPLLAQAPAKETPVQIVTLIYKQSAGKSGKYDVPSAFSSRAIRSRYFSKAFLGDVNRAEALSKKLDEPILDFDPVTNSQEPSVNKLQITSESEDDNAAVVAATFYSFEDPKPMVVRYLFIREGSGWRLDDMTGAHDADKWELRKMLADAMVQALKDQPAPKGNK
ncbi:hypothetical protein PY365_14130 [Roseiarcaceae bacterium H3SJ34-1]|uniref:hypothetical protein n=1 Tax=Terripilifer ovatus TaxID=3032367 RepID=UPI003AB9656A|nr:hypothetical protein [Roseiarcaceae bacterium H3SJ34-1]